MKEKGDQRANNDRNESKYMFIKPDKTTIDVNDILTVVTDTLFICCLQTTRSIDIATFIQYLIFCYFSLPGFIGTGIMTYTIERNLSSLVLNSVQTVQLLFSIIRDT
jgi:hypothetical protein